ncbi:hypothetical protein [Robbsia andropogonis]|uniref:hypothetical protein n=1 Tax=Robbsia andropogonis TaxID=28092 RepID=UPI00209CB8B0|nr:hypothetical protein [Robbsia andropogonis]MCP1116707.1 hypothetical protein [Robbsia andropogonis]MCP1126614.1 hypothetical protein [Robbsia andropogonis]
MYSFPMAPFPTKIAGASRFRGRDHCTCLGRCISDARGAVLLEWALAAALGMMFSVAIVAALIGFRKQASEIAETARLQSDAGIALRFLRHYIERSDDPIAPGRHASGRLRCGNPQPGNGARQTSARAADASSISSMPGWRCDLRSHRGVLAMDYPTDGDASWRDANGYPADCKGVRIPEDRRPKSQWQDTQMMHAALSISVTAGDATPSLFCSGSRDVIQRGQPAPGSAMVDGIERLVVWRTASMDEVCIVMRGRTRRSFASPFASRADGPHHDARAQMDASYRKGRDPRGLNDRCDGSLTETGALQLRADYGGADGYRRHVVRAAWPRTYFPWTSLAMHEQRR